MFKKAASEDGKDVKYLIPYLLFACWEVPQSSTRFFSLSNCCIGDKYEGHWISCGRHAGPRGEH